MAKRLVLHVPCVGAALLLAACGTPYSDRLSAIDWSASPAAGTISISQPRMFRRASLINERRLDADWLNQQLENSKTIDFKPEIAREVEQITAFAAALGLSFDPASALNYRRASETGDLQQQIQVMKLQLQLDQLKRDAELVRGKFASQTDPVNSALGAASASAPAPAVAGVTAASADQLKAAIDKLTANLATRLDVDAKPPAIAQTSVNPADVFRDRAAYRDLLKSARNAVSLDDLHDYGGSALIRLNFQAMVLPDRTTSNIPGVVQMTIKSPVADASEMQQIYRGWLDHVNQRLSQRSADGWKIDDEILNSAASDNFDVVEYLFVRPPKSTAIPTPSAAHVAPEAAKVAARARPLAKDDTGAKAARSPPPKPAPAPASAPKPAPAPAPVAAKALNCPGLTFSGQTGDAECGRLVFAVPRFQGKSIQEGATATLEQYGKWFNPKESEQRDRDNFTKEHASLVKNAKTLVRECGLPAADPPTPGAAPSDAYVLYVALLKAQIRSAAGDVFAMIYRDARRLLGLNWPATDGDAQLIATRAARAKQLLLTFEAGAYQGCKPDRRKAFRDSMPGLYIPPGFEEVLKGDDRVAVYDIGPREQVQQVSTISRVANNLALAVSLAAAAPKSGAAANAAASYSRQSTGKAAALERVPALIGYSTGSTFGWVVGPKATVDPKGSLNLEQSPRTLDLSVDLSVPGWWPSLTIETTTAWAASREAVTSGTVQVVGTQPGQVKVPMEANYADYEVLTARIMRGGVNETRQVSLETDRLKEQSVSACRATSVYLSGPNVWRAENILIAGYRLDQSAITVSPDMRGVLLNVPALDELVGDVTAATLPVSVLTRYGDVRGDVGYIPKPASGSCKPVDKKAADGPAITSVVPTQFRAGADVVFTVEGSKFDQLNQVAINGQPGTLTVDKGGKRMQAKFTATQTASLSISRSIPLSFFKDTEKLAEKPVEVTAVIGAK